MFLYLFWISAAALGMNVFRGQYQYQFQYLQNQFFNTNTNTWKFGIFNTNTRYCLCDVQCTPNTGFSTITVFPFLQVEDHLLGSIKAISASIFVLIAKGQLYRLHASKMSTSYTRCERGRWVLGAVQKWCHHGLLNRLDPPSPRSPFVTFWLTPFPLM